MPAVKSKASQDFVPIREVRDGVVVLEDGGLRVLLLASSINFALKSDEERQAIILQFQAFLNSLDFSIQIFLQSKRLDIRPYLGILQNRLKEQPNELMRIQTQEYIEFVKNFTDKTEIMKKTFFIVIPYSPQMLQTGKGGKTGPLSGVTSLLGKKNKNKVEVESEDVFEENRSQLEERVAVVEQGLVRCGVHIARLGTEETIEVFYKIFNPGETDKPIQVN